MTTNQEILKDLTNEVKNAKRTLTLHTNTLMYNVGKDDGFIDKSISPEYNDNDWYILGYTQGYIERLELDL